MLATRVLVTGSSGFIGQHVVKALVGQDYEVMGIDLQFPHGETDHFTFQQCDLLDKPKLERVVSQFAPQAIVHLAARTDLDETQDLQGYAANVAGVENLVAAIRATASVKRCIFTSSQLVCEIGYVPKHDQDYKPSTLYGESKVLGETIVRQSDGGGVVWCLARPTTIWGPGMNAHYQNYLRLISTGQYFHAGPKPLYKSYGFVRNVAYQYRRLLEAPESAIHRKMFYVADYQPISLREWSNAFQRELGARPILTVPVRLARIMARAGDGLNACGWRKFPFNSFRLKNILTEYQFDLAPTRAVCGEVPYPLDQGVTETVAWFINHDSAGGPRPLRYELKG